MVQIKHSAVFILVAAAIAAVALPASVPSPDPISKDNEKIDASARFDQNIFCQYADTSTNQSVCI